MYAEETCCLTPIQLLSSNETILSILLGIQSQIPSPHQAHVFQFHSPISLSSSLRTASTSRYLKVVAPVATVRHALT